MKFIVTENYEAMSRTAARVISGYVSSHPDCVLGLATGLIRSMTRATATSWSTTCSPMLIDPARIHVPDGACPDADAACAAYEQAIAEAGGLSLQLLGKEAAALCR